MAFEEEGSSSVFAAYMIFLSFNGDDTRNNYTSFLWEFLRRTGFNVFLDDKSVCMGKRIAYEIPNAINNSMGAVIIFSENYAASEWCLDELLLILERKRLLGDSYVLQAVYFGGIKPNDLKHPNRSSYGKAFAEHGNRFPYNRVKSWKDALREVSGLSGKILSSCKKWNESVNEIAEEFQEKFINPSVTVNSESKKGFSHTKDKYAKSPIQLNGHDSDPDLHKWATTAGKKKRKRRGRPAEWSAQTISSTMEFATPEIPEDAVQLSSKVTELSFKIVELEKKALGLESEIKKLKNSIQANAPTPSSPTFRHYTFS